MPAPRLRNVCLPHVGFYPAVDPVIGTHELYPTPLIFEGLPTLERRIDQVLRYHDSPRCIVKPVIGQRPAAQTPTQYHWGMSEALAVDTSPFVLICPEGDIPATNPPTTMMIIQTPPWSRDITILPKPNLDFVTSTDVQKEVAKWMKEAAESSVLPDMRAAFSQAEKFSLPDGREINIGLWQWRGLRRHGLESHTWDLCL